MRLLLLLLVVGCAGPPARKAPPAELPADKAADLAGRWAMSDDMDWMYSMELDGNGGVDVWIDRGKMGRCEQKGTMKPQGTRTFVVTYTRGECNPQAVNMPIEMKISSFTGGSLTLVVAGQARTYQRAPEQTAGPHPAVQLR